MKASNVLSEQKFNKDMEAVKKSLYSEISTDLNIFKQNDVQDFIVDLSILGKSEGQTKNVIKALSRIGYKAGNAIGLIISLLSIADTLKDNTLNKQFLKAGSDSEVCMYKMKKVFKNIGHGKKKGYVQIFSEEKYIKAVDKGGRITYIVLALKEDIKNFVDYISQVGSLTREDLVKIGKDLSIIATVASELELDSVKKPWLKEGLPEVENYMSDIMNLQSKVIGINHNLKDVFDSHKDKSKEDVEFSMEMSNDGFPLIEFDKRWEEKEKEIVETQEYKEADTFNRCKMLNYHKFMLLKKAYVKDPFIDFANIVLNQQTSNIKNLLLEHKKGDNSIFEDFSLHIDPKKELEYRKLTHFAVKVVSMINSNFANKNDMALFRVDESVKYFRNMLFTYGKSLGFSSYDTFCICANAAWYKITGRRYSKTDYAFKAMELLFSDELKFYFNSKALDKEVNIELPEEIFEIEDAIYDNMVLEFKDGKAIIHESEEFGTLYATRHNASTYSGKVEINIDEDGYLHFIEKFEAFKFDEVEFALFDNLVNTQKPDSQFSIELVNSFDELSKEEKDAKYKQRYEDSKVNIFDDSIEDISKSVEDFDHFITLISNDSNFNMYKYENIYFILHKSGKGYLLGKILDNNIKGSLYNASSVKTFTTPIGSLLIVQR